MEQDLIEITIQVKSSNIDQFSIRVSPSLPHYIISNFNEWLKQHIEKGATFSDGHTLQYGFTTFSCKIKEKKLLLQCPDYQNMPIQWVENTSYAFELMIAHQYIPESFGLEASIPTIRCAGIAGVKFSEKPMFINREKARNKNDSGWFVGNQSDGVDNQDVNSLQLMSLYQIGIHAPQILPFLSLPIGCTVMFSQKNEIAFYKDGEELKPSKDSYLDLHLRKVAENN